MININKNGSVLLTLPNKNYKSTRYLGEIKDNTFYCRRDPSKHLFYKFNAYGFSYELMRDGQFKFISVKQPDGTQLLTTRSSMLANCRFLNFSKNQLERQIFYPLSEFCKTKEEADLKEKRILSELESQKTEKSHQDTLFSSVA